MKVRREPRKPFSPLVNDAQITKMVTVVFENGERTTLKMLFLRATRGLTRQEMKEQVLSDFKAIHKVVQVIIK